MTELKKMTREDVTNSKEYQLAKLAMEWFAAHDNDDVDALDGYEAGYQQAIEHPTGGELLHVLNKGHKQGYKDAIKDACELLARMVWEVTYEDLECNSTHHCDKVEFIEDFKKAMEEQL